MARAIRLHQTGGPEVLELQTVEVGAPGPGQARVRHSYVAVNFIDIYFRTGRYPLPLPNGLGSDAVGVVEASATASRTFVPATASATCSARRARTPMSA
jgi:NADPH2:quinone reductase